MEEEILISLVSWISILDQEIRVTAREASIGLIVGFEHRFLRSTSFNVRMVCTWVKRSLRFVCGVTVVKHRFMRRDVPPQRFPRCYTSVYASTSWRAASEDIVQWPGASFGIVGHRRIRSGMSPWSNSNNYSWHRSINAWPLAASKFAPRAQTLPRAAHNYLRRPTCTTTVITAGWIRARDDRDINHTFRAIYLARGSRFTIFGDEIVLRSRQKSRACQAHTLHNVHDPSSRRNRSAHSRSSHLPPSRWIIFCVVCETEQSSDRKVFRSPCVQTDSRWRCAKYRLGTN